MADTSYYTFCPHCERDLPARTFRYHREQYYDTNTNRWEKSICHSDSSDDGILPMDDDSSDENINNGNISHNTLGVELSQNNSDDLLHNEIWDDLLPSDLIDNFPDPNTPLSNDTANTMPTAAAQHHDGTGNLISRCLLVLLTYLWTFFRISDNAMEFMLSVLEKIFAIAATTSNLFSSILSVFPRSLFALRKEVGLGTDTFTKYVVCPRCHCIYQFEDSYRTVGSIKQSKRCCFVKFPNHRQLWRRTACGAMLLKEVTLKSWVKRLYQHKVYCYYSIIESLRELVKRPNFTLNCEL